jgi:hypothetical protein
MAADSRGRCRPAVLGGDCDVAIIMGGDLIELLAVDAGSARWGGAGHGVAPMSGR